MVLVFEPREAAEYPAGQSGVPITERCQQHAGQEGLVRQRDCGHPAVTVSVGCSQVTREQNASKNSAEH